ncbi:epididymal-specific lipocalin-8 isoform 1-T1 [Glossophaga mutica]
MAPKRLEALFLTWSEAELTVKAAYSSLGSCETENIVGSEVDVSGKFAFPGHREIRVIDTDYERYAILRLSLAWHGEDIHVLKYFTRSLEDDYEPGLWKFRELTADTGLYLLARQGQCAKLLKQFSGLWYEIAFASKPQSLTPELRKMGTVLVELEGGHLALTTAYDDENRCVKDKSLALKGDAPGKFKLPKKSEEKEVSVVDTDYKTYAILDVVQHRGGKSHRVMKLYSRSLDHNQEALRRLQEVAGEHGFTPWQVHLLNLESTCVKALQPGSAPSS